MKEKKKYLLIILLICISTLLGFIGHKYLETHLRIENRVNSFPLIHSVENMDEGLVHIAFNYLSLMGSTDQNILSLSIRVKNNIIKNDTFFTLFSLIRFIYAIVTLIVPFILLKKFKKFNDLEKTVYIYVCSQVFILYFFFLIGNMYEWYRYVTPLIISLNMLYPLLYKYYLSDTKKHRISFNISLSAICITALFFVISSYYNFETHKFRENPYQELVNLLLENDLHFGYTYTGREHNLYFTLSNGQITAGRLDYDGTPDYWLTSTDWYKDDYYDGKVFFLRRRREYRFSFEEKAIDVLHFKHYDITVFEKLSDITSTFDKKEKEDKND